MNDLRIALAHGSGGKLMQQFINKFILSNFGNQILNRLDDGAVFDIDLENKRLVFTTDSFVVDPIFFPGGDIGKLAICGTVNDLSMMGARPLFLSASVILEEGFELKNIKKIITSMKDTLRLANVAIVCGDTKVVNKGNCDKIFINTAGIGVVHKSTNISSNNAQPGDLIIVSGTIGEHGVSILSQREGLKFKNKLKSDCAPLNGLVAQMIKFPHAVHVLRDPTRGGMATALNEIAEHSNLGIEIDEECIPISSAVKGVCEILGIDPLYLPSEGRLLAFVRKDKAEQVVKKMRKNLFGKKAAVIGYVTPKHKKEVYLKTVVGGMRILDVPIQEQMPRIC